MDQELKDQGKLVGGQVFKHLQAAPEIRGDEGMAVRFHITCSSVSKCSISMEAACPDIAHLYTSAVFDVAEVWI